MTPGRRGRIALAVAGSAAFALTTHLALVQGIPAAVGALLCLVPLGAFALWGLKQPGHRVLVAGALAAIVFLMARNWSLLEQHFPDVFFVEHIAINLTLAYVFGRTLRPGREPLVTRFARLVHGGITADVAGYTRKVTLAWTAFFLTMILASSLLYASQWMAAWSLLVNFVNPILLGVMFVVEYAIRHRVLPDLERIGLLGGIQAFSRHFGESRPMARRAEAPR